MLGMIAQVLLLRQAMATFSGNELSLGITLGWWLIWVGTGSGLTGNFLIRSKNILHKWFWLGTAFIIFIPLGTIGFMWTGILWGNVIGEIFGINQIFISIMVLLFFPAIGLGAWFTLFCKFSENYVSSDNQAPLVYLWEALGGALGGIIFSYILAKQDFLSNWSIAVLISIGFSLIMILYLHKMKFDKKHYFILPVVLIILLCTAGIIGINKWSLSKQWEGYEVLESRNSPYGQLVVLGRNEQTSIFENGVLSLTIPDPETAENFIHFGMVFHPDPKNILLLGGGGEGITECLKYGDVNIDYVELDPTFVEILKNKQKNIFDKPEVKIRNMDGRLFIEKNDKKYDVISISLPDPINAHINRFYTVEFFESVYKKLNDPGILTFSVSGAENYISEELQTYLACLKSTILKVFPNVVILPGESARFIAGTPTTELIRNADKIETTLKERNVNTKYVRACYLSDRLSDLRCEQIDKAIASADPKININKDLYPICFYYSVALWTKQKTPFIASVMEEALDLSISFLIILFSIFIIILFVLVNIFDKKKSGKVNLSVLIFIVGLLEMTLVVVTFLGFNSTFGYVYEKIGLLTASFMLGNGMGAWKIVRSSKSGKKTLFIFYFLLVIFILIIPVIFAMILKLGGGIFFELVIYIMVFAAGYAGGAIYPIAYRIWNKISDETAGAGGILYAFDLFGSALGALMASTFLLPLYGIPATCIMVGLISALWGIISLYKIKWI